MMEARLRLGILGAARNVPFSVLKPIQANPDLAAKIDVVGLASLEKVEAEKLAKEWGIRRAYDSFEEMLADPAVDAVYNVLPSQVRCHWTVRALQAGKHVLSETPMSLNAREAMLAQRAAEDMGRVLLEGTHPTSHPVTKRVRKMIQEGKVGLLEHIDLNLPIGHALQGEMVCSKAGALMSLGVHGIAIVRAIAGEDPRVISAAATLSNEDKAVDSAISCNLKMPGGAVAHIGCSITKNTKKAPTMFTISGSCGTIRVKEWFTGQGKSSNEIELEQFEECGENFVERVDNPPVRDTFYFQLLSFVDEVREQEKRQASADTALIGMPWSYTKSKGPSDAVMTMAVIDAVYKAAGMNPRQTTETPPAPYDTIGRSKL